MELAEHLWRARIDGELINTSKVELPTDIATAYKVQDAVVHVANAVAIGFKLGATSEDAINALGVTESFYGPLFDRYCYQNGGQVILPYRHKILIEVEIAVGLHRDLPSRCTPYKWQEVEDATAWVSPSFELVATRFDAEMTGNGVLLIADGGANAGIVLGDRVTNWRKFNLTQHPVELFVNDRLSAVGNSGLSIFCNPFAAVAWLANHRRLVRRGLKAGDIITTGTCTGMTPLESGDIASADLGLLGKLYMNLVSQ